MRVLNRGTGLLVIEVRCSNPNGDPDAESEPRTLESGTHGLISPVSFKRKLRDLVADKNGPVWQTAESALRLSHNVDARQYQILEMRGRDRKTIGEMNSETFRREFWDARVFGNTFLEAIEGERKGDHFISTGVTQFGAGFDSTQIAPGQP